MMKKVLPYPIIPLALAILVGLTFFFSSAPITQANTAAPNLATLPLMFIEQQPSRYQVHLNGQSMWFTENGMWLTTKQQNIKLTFQDTNPHARIEPLNKLETRISNFRGNDPAKWQTDVRVYGGVRYRNLYPNTDLIITSEQGQLAWQWETTNVGAGLVPARVADGQTGQAQGLPLPGNVHVSVDNGHTPTTHTLDPNQSLTDQLAAIIDPQTHNAKSNALTPRQQGAADLVWSTFLGGSTAGGGTGEDNPNAILTDASGNIYITGVTGSADFTTSGSYDTSYNGGYDGFVAKLNSNGTSLSYITFLGGSGLDTIFDIAFDSVGNATLTGWTSSPNFPTTVGAYDTSFNGGDYDAFVVKLNSSGTSLIYSTLLGGNDFDKIFSLALDSADNIYLTGQTESANFPTTVGAYDTSFNGGTFGGDVFFAKLNSSGATLTYATYLGGISNEISTAISLDSTNNAYLTGFTYSSDFPATVGAYDTSFNGGPSTFVVKFNNSGTLNYATFMGSSTAAISLALDSGNNAYIAGSISSAGLPTTVGAYDTSYNGGLDAFIVKLNSSGAALSYATYLGGSVNDFFGTDDHLGSVLVVDNSGNAILTGNTTSTDFPTTGWAHDTSHNGAQDTFIVKLNSSGTALLYSTLLGGTSDDVGRGLVVDSANHAIVTGYTYSSGFPTTAGVYDTSYNGISDIFVTKLSMSIFVTSLTSFSGPTTGSTNTNHTYNVTVSPVTATFPITYTWQAADFAPIVHVVSRITDSVTFNWPTPGFKQVTISVTNGGAPVSTGQSVAIYAPPQASFTRQPATALVDQNITITNTSVGSYTSVLWNFGDGQSSNSTNSPLFHSYTTTGTKIISLTVSGYGLNSTFTQSVNIVDACVPSFTHTPLNGTVPLTVTLTDTSSGDCSTTTWHFGDGSTSNALNPTHTYNMTGTLTIALVRGATGGTTVTTTDSIQLFPRAIANFTVDKVSGEAPLTVCFTNTSQYNNSFSWSFGDGSAADNVTLNPCHTYTVGGLYQATLTVTGQGAGNSATKTVPIEATTALKPLFSISPISGTVPPAAQICFANHSTPLDATSTWNFGDGSLLDFTRSPCHFYTTTNTYTVSLTLTSAKSSAMTSATVSIYQLCVADFTFSPSPAFVGQTVQVTNSSTGDCTLASFNWGDGTSHSQLTHVYTQAGTFALTLTMQGNGGRKEKVSTITIVPPTKPQIIANPDSGDEPLMVQFDLVDKGSYNQQNWSFGDGTNSSQPRPLHEFLTANNYLVTVVLTGPLGSVVISRPITVTRPPLANFKPLPSSGQTPLAVTMNNLSTGDIASYLWDLGNGNSSTDKVPPMQNYSTGIYTVTLTVTGVSGKTDSHREIITVYDPCVADFTVLGATQAELPPLSLNVSNSSTHCTHFHWEFGDGAVSDWFEPDHLYTRAGHFSLTLIASGPVNSMTKTLTPPIEVGDPLCQINPASLKLTPNNPLDDDNLIVDYLFSCTQRQQAAEGVRLQWLQQGQPVSRFDLMTSALQATLPATATRPFDKWKVAVTPYKGNRDGTTVESNEVYIQQKPNTPPTATVTIAPATPIDDDTLTLSYRYFDADGDAEQPDKLQVLWFLANQLQPAYKTTTVPMDATNPQETWCARVRVNDGQEYGPSSPLACVTIGTGKNHAPQVLNATMMVQRQNVNGILRVTGIYSDVDLPCSYCGRKVETLPLKTVARFQWFRNGVLQPEFNDQTLITRSVTFTGELWHVAMQVNDGIDDSIIVNTPSINLIATQNTPPQVTNLRIVAVDIQGRAQIGDPEDNDNLTVVYDFVDPDGHTERGSQIYWYNPLTRVVKFDGLRMIPAEETVVNQYWYARVIPCDDGQACGDEEAADSVQIQPDSNNTPPQNRKPTLENLRIVPLTPALTDTLTLQYQFNDADGDIEQGTEIRWTVNGTLHPSLNDVSNVPKAYLRVGEKWCVEVQPVDERGETGAWYGPECVTVQAAATNHQPRAKDAYLSSANLPYNQTRKPADSENLELHYTFIDDDCAPSAYKSCEHNSEIRWYRDGARQDAFDNLTVVSATATAPGQKWYATIRPHDGQLFGAEVKTMEVVINHQPELSGVTFTPMSPTPALTLTATCAYTDADGDAPSLLSYRWSRDGNDVAMYNDQPSLPPQALHEGETWTVTCTAHDGIESGNTLSGTVKIGAIRIYLPLIIKQGHAVQPTTTPSTPTVPIPTSTPPVAFEQPVIMCNPNQNYEPNNNRTDLCPIQLNQTYTAYPDDRFDYYTFELTETLSIKGEIKDYTEGSVRIYNSFDGRETMIEWQIKDNIIIPNTAMPNALVNLAPGRYTLLIDTTTLSTDMAYQLTLTALPKRP